MKPPEFHPHHVAQFARRAHEIEHRRKQAHERATVEHLRAAGIVDGTVDHGKGVNKDRYLGSLQMGASGTVAVTTGGQGGGKVQATMSRTVGKVNLHLDIPSTSGAVTVAIYADDEEITDASNRPSLAAGQGNAILDGSALATAFVQGGQWLSFDVKAAGTGASGLAISLQDSDLPPLRRTQT